MEVKQITGGVCAPQGFTAAGLHCGIAKDENKKDLALIYSEKPANAAAMYTQNKVCGAPIIITKTNLNDGIAQAIICNSGNANTCNSDGERVALAMCVDTAEELKIHPENVIVASTGVIGKRLDITPIKDSLPQLVKGLSSDGSDDAADAIMTTDLIKKEIAAQFEIGGKACRIGGIAKGSGMICPNMATMLSFITTDAAISSDMLKTALEIVVRDTFNMVSVDGDTSTNDMVAIMANGLAENTMIEADGEDFQTFTFALMYICIYLARAMAKDGEGATKLIECTVNGAPDEECARRLAKSVICSSLFKAAMFGADANWGRILCALGYADVNFDVNKTKVEFKSKAGCIVVCEDGAGVDFDEEKAKQILSEDEIELLISLDQGEGDAVAWGCDLSYDYVKINGDYRS